jgi:hypothetical protein
MVASFTVTSYGNTMIAKRHKPATRGRPKTGTAMTAAERMRRMRVRRKSAGLKEVITWVPSEPIAQEHYSTHRLLEARSLAMHALIAGKLARNPSLLSKPRQNLENWSARWHHPPRWVREWRQILGLPWQQIAALIAEPSERAARLRQSSPFAGVLTPEERSRIYDAFRP